MSDELTYADKVGVALLNLNIHDVLIIEELVDPANRSNFIEIVKSYIDRNFGKNEGWQLVFNSDYTKIRKDRL